MTTDSIGRNIRKYRVEKKMRQEDLAEKTGLSANYIGMLERGECSTTSFNRFRKRSAIKSTRSLIR